MFMLTWRHFTHPLHAHLKCPVLSPLISLQQAHFQQKISSTVECKKEMMTSDHSQRRISTSDVQNILNTAHFLCQHSNIYFPFRGKSTCDAAPYIAVHTTRILCPTRPQGHTFEMKSCQSESHFLLFNHWNYFQKPCSCVGQPSDEPLRVQHMP